MTVTSIRQTSPGRLTVCFEDGSEIKSTLGAVTELRLYSGRELDDKQTEEFKSLSSRSLARERALEIVSRRRMSEKELRDKLLQKGFDEDTADYCVRWLSENAFLNDEEYSLAVARHYAGKGYGEGRIRAELSRRGIDRELWDEALCSAPDSSDKLRKFISARLKDPSDRDAVRKVSQALYRRGYSWDDIRTALGEFEADTEVY